MTKVFLDGQEVSLNDNLSLFENLKQRDLILGFCSHPLIKNDRHCNLCWVYDEGEEGIVRSCEVTPKEGSRYNLHSAIASKAVNESLDSLIQYHQPQCKKCNQKNLCHIKGILKDDSSIRSLERQGEVEKKTYSSQISFSSEQCISCSLCVKFEENISDSPALIENETGKVSLKTEAKHNYGINLIDLCPTGCFSQKSMTQAQPSFYQKDFCRVCDRLCETESLFLKDFDSHKPFRQRAPQGAAYWLCDEVNNGHKIENLGLPLKSIMKKDGERWTAGELPESSRNWHFVLPENLPTEIWNYLNTLLDNSQYTFEFIKESPRNSVEGILRQSKAFKQKSRDDFFERNRERERALLTKGSNTEFFFISPEYLEKGSQFEKNLNQVKSKKAVWAGFFITPQLLKGVGHIVPLPDYRLLKWDAINYHNELRENDPFGESVHLKLFKDKE